jgi:single-strand DNA-binding protein
MDYNKIVLIGRLGKDPTAIQTKSGTAMCKLRMATSEKRKSGDSTIETTQWHDVLVFGKSASNCLQYLAKGRELWVEGKLEYKTRQLNGVDIREASVVADSVGFIGSKTQRKETTEAGSVLVSSVTGDDHINTSHEVLIEREMQEE